MTTERTARDFGIACITVVVLSLYYSLYTLGLRLGTYVEPPAAVAYLKVLILPLVLMLVDWKRHVKMRLEDILVIATLVAFFITWLMKAILLPDTNTLFLNLALASSGILLILFGIDTGSARTLFRVTAIVLVGQTAMDGIIYASGLSLWENRAFIGGFGNGSIFGFMCSISVAYLLFAEAPSRRWASLAVPLAAGVIMSNALFQILLLGVIVFVWAAQSLKRGVALLAAAGASVGYVGLYGADFLSQHVIHKWQSLIAVVQEGGVYGTSRSVSLRVQIHEDFISNLTQAPFHVLLIGYPNVAYYTADSQFLTMVGSFGVLLTGLFAIGLIGYVIEGSRYRDSWSNGATVMVICFMMVFVVNRMLDYFPAALYLIVALSIIRSRRAETELRSVQRFVPSAAAPAR